MPDFEAIEVPMGPNHIKKFVRDLKEDPWEMMRMVRRKMPNTVKCCMAGGNIPAFAVQTPRSLVELFYTSFGRNRRPEPCLVHIQHD